MVVTVSVSDCDSESQSVESQPFYYYYYYLKNLYSAFSRILMIFINFLNKILQLGTARPRTRGLCAGTGGGGGGGFVNRKK